MKPHPPSLRQPGARPAPPARPSPVAQQRLVRSLWALATVCSMASLRAEERVDLSPFTEQARALALQGTASLQGLRVEVETGRLDPRLKLAPCSRIEPYLPPGFRAWGATRVGLRCLEGATRWNVYLPVTIRVFGPALVAATVLPAGTPLTESDLRVEEVDLAAQVQPAVVDVMAAVGRPLTVALKPGESLRQHHLRPRQWFAAGETVKLIARGPGFAVEGEGLAMAPGLEGQTVRIRTESGRIVSGLPAGERRVELPL
jgi:flagella basal body P-ring formation protein FlgA